jgi:sugar O-acyltransferase (sialic acid O-acetyltransferase NeuD family)
VLGNNSVLPELARKGVKEAIIAIGENFVRNDYTEDVRKAGMELINAIHPDSVRAYTASFGKGVVVAAGAIICSHAKIGDNAIINTGAIIEHHVEVGKNVHIGPGVRIAGRTRIGDGAFIGIGSTITDNVKIGSNTVIGAGAVVTGDLPADSVAVGVPAKVIRKRSEREPVFK